MDRIPVSANVPAELAERISDVPEPVLEIPDFAETDDYAGVVREPLKAPLALLFSTRDQILGIQRIEALNKDRALEWLLKDLAALERALYQVWSEQ